MFLYDRENPSEEDRATLSRLSDLPCFPDTDNGVGCPSELCPKDRAPKWCLDRVWGDLDAVAGEDKEFKRWLLKHLRWDNPPVEPPLSLPDDAIIEEHYLPFTTVQLRGHFLQSSEKHLKYYLRSAERYRRFKGSPVEQPEDLGEWEEELEAALDEENWQRMALARLKAPCQIQKDERFWVATCLMHYYHRQPDLLPRLMQVCFGKNPPASIRSKLGPDVTWEQCFEGKLHLFFEATLESPTSYKDKWVPAHVGEHIIPYVRRAGEGRKRLEGPTHADALLFNERNGLGVLFEAKVLSDISYQISYDALRNQIARSIDVMLESHTLPGLHFSERQGPDPDLTMFVLLTPEVFRRYPHSRLYGLLLPAYRRYPHALARDLLHREGQGIDWKSLPDRIGWLTWEDCLLRNPENEPLAPWARGPLLESLQNPCSLATAIPEGVPLPWDPGQPLHPFVAPARPGTPDA